MAVGYRREDIEDESLEDVEAVVADASILWSPGRLTEVRVELRTETNPTTLADASAAILYSGTVAVARQMTPRLRMEIGGGVDHERFVGAGRDDTTYFGFVGASYAFSRFASLLASYGYEHTERGDGSPDTDANVVGVRMRLQR